MSLDNGTEPSAETIQRTEAEILEIISAQEKEEATHDTMGFSLSEFEQILKLEILDMAREMKVIQRNFGPPETIEEKLNVLKRQKFAVWFLWDGMNIVRVERGLVVNIYIHTSGKDIIHNRDIWHMIKDILSRCHNREGGLVESTELELRSKMIEWKINPEIKRMTRQVVLIGDREEEFDLVPDYRILRNENEIYEVTLTDRRTGIKATGRGNVKYRNQVDWGTKLELSKKVREFEWSNREVENEN